MSDSKNEKKQYGMDLTQGSILNKMLRFCVPLMFSSILQLLFNAADIVVVGRFAGDASLAAVGSNVALINLLTNLFIGLSVGVNVLAARYYGAKEDNELSKTVHTAICVGILSGLFLNVFGVIGAKQILVWMKTPKNVLPLATLYLRVYFFGMTAMMVYNFGSALLRAMGDTKRPLYFLLGSGIVNLVLNMLFVIVFRMDVVGVGLATVISQWISGILVLMCLIKEQGAMHLNISQIRIDRTMIFKILKIGIPAGIQGVVFSLSNVVIQTSVNSFGSVVMAGNSAAQNLEGFVYMAMNAFHQGAVTFTSQNMGAGKKNRILKITIVALLCVIVVGEVFGNGMFILGRSLLGIYSKSPSVVEAGMTRLKMICTIYALCGIMDVMVGVLRGLGYSVMPMIVSLFGACGLRLLWIATIFSTEKYHTIEMLYLSYAVSWIITVSIHVICYCVVGRKRGIFDLKTHQIARK
ncbi:MAG: MATE family efflux transporter [Eubacteriales bacterium]|nr:MATE family efflux transporter [Eubacteriales bacterium]